MSWCTACGRKAQANDQFCQGCGTPLEAKAAPEAVAADTVPRPLAEDTAADQVATWSADPPPARPRSGRTLSIVATVCGVLVIGAAAAVIAVGLSNSHKHDEMLKTQAHVAPSHSPSPAPTTAAPSPSAPHSAAPTPSSDPAAYQARALDTLLTAAGVARGKVGTAVGQLQACQADPYDTVQTLQSAIDVRTQVLSQLETLDTSALPTSLVDGLRNSEQLSVDADDAYQSWAESLEGYFCSGSADLTSEFHAGDAYSQQATAAKTAFINAGIPSPPGTVWHPDRPATCDRAPAAAHRRLARHITRPCLRYRMLGYARRRCSGFGGWPQRNTGSECGDRNRRPHRTGLDRADLGWGSSRCQITRPHPR